MRRPNDHMIENYHFIRQPYGCWTWLLARRNGYGVVSVSGRQWTAHRWAYLLSKGPIPKGLLVCHSCDNPACVNPEHLWLGTQLANRRDAVRKNRQACGERQGKAKLTDAEVLFCREHAGIPVKYLAEFFKVCESTIYQVLSRQIWKHLRKGR